jgi:autotransporter-associated beta strand protein
VPSILEHFALFTVFTIFTHQEAASQTSTWRGNHSYNSNWNAAQNWTLQNQIDNKNTDPVTNGDSLLFQGTKRLNNNNDLINWSFANINFDANAGSFTLNGNAITLTGSVNNNSSSTQTFNLAALSFAGTRTVNAAAGDILLNSVIQGNGGLSKTGANDLFLSKNNTYLGATTVSAGTVVVNSGASITPSTTTVGSVAGLKVNGSAGTVIVNGRLSGSGSVGALSLNSGGTLAVGNSPGLLHASSATWNPNSNFEFEITNAIGTAGTSWDLLSVGGSLDLTTISSTNKMNLKILSTALLNYNSDTEYSWIFAQAASLGGTNSWLSGLDVTDRFAINSTGFNDNNQPGRGFKVVTGTSGSLATLSLVAIPEPTAGSLLLLGIAVMLGVRRAR